MREIKIQDWCDICFKRDESKEPAEHKVTFGLVEGDIKPGLHVMDLCDTDLKLVKDTVSLWLEMARPAEANTVAPVKVVQKKYTYEIGKRLDCPLCDKDFGNKQTVVKHVWSVHRGMKQPPQPESCPTCRAEYAPQGMVMHRSKIHGYDQMQDAMNGAT